MDSVLLQAVRNREVAFFLGAGVSMVPPSCLPGWWAVNHAVLDALADIGHEAYADTSELARLVKEREADGKLPPEFAAETITDRFGESYFEVLQCLEGETPNRTHHWLAALGKAGLLPAIVTTNFDTLTERAFADAGAPLQVCVTPEEFATVPDRLEDSTSPTLLLKLHGTASRPETCVDTLAQRKKGLPAEVTAALNAVGNRARLVVLGYSGADLDADPAYLGFRTRRDSSPGIVWLYRTGTPPAEPVARLAKDLGPQAVTLAEGELSGWLDPLREVLPEGVPAPRVGDLTETEIANARERAALAVADHARTWATERGAAECVLVLSDLAVAAGYRDAALAALTHMVEGSADMHLSPFGRGLVHHTLAAIAQHQGRNADALAHYQQAHAGYQEDGTHPEGLVYSLQGAARVLAEMGEHQQATEILNRCLAYTRDAGEADGEVIVLSDLADVAREQGRFQEALERFAEAEQLATAQGLEFRRAGARLGVAIIQEEAGNAEAAEEAARDALQVFLRLGNDGMAAEAMQQLASLAWNAGRPEEAVATLDRARVLIDRVADLPRLANHLQLRGNMATSNGEYDAAVSLLEEALELAQKEEDRGKALSIRQNVASVEQARGNLDAAEEIGRQVLAEAERMDLKQRAAGMHNNLGIIAEQRGNLDAALSHYRQAGSIFEATSNRSGVAQAQGNIANLHFRQQNYTEARTGYEAALAAFSEMRDTGSRLRTLANLANALVALGEHAEAEARYTEALETAQELGQRPLELSILVNLANLHYHTEAFAKVRATCEQAAAMAEDLGDRFSLGFAFYLGSLAAAQEGDAPLARRLIEQCVTTWQHVDPAPPQMAHAQQMLDALQTQG